MKCPPDIADVLLGILDTGVIHARAAGWSGDADRAAHEANHVHNLAGIVAEFDPARLRYYWNVERPEYMRGSTPARAASFRPLWERLRAHIEQAVPAAAAGC